MLNCFMMSLYKLDTRKTKRRDVMQQTVEVKEVEVLVRGIWRKNNQ
ncbi:hypothetical protein B4143_2034 [Bacillus subtilis]|nr:hypothetical protein B4143_2034 [Bacillus subtilis]